MSKLKDYLINKINRVNVSNPKANTGAVLMKLYPTYEEDMDSILKQVIQVVNILFKKDTPDYPIGITPLTNTSMKIGEIVYKFMNRKPVTWVFKLRLGDLYIEALYNCGYIDIDYPQRRDSSHIVKPTSNWAELASLPKKDNTTCLSATSLSKPEFKLPTLKNPLQNAELDIDSPFVRSINKLQQTPWRINEPVFNALKKAKGFVSSCKEKDDMKELKRLSKIIEWAFIKAKAEEVIGNDFYQEVSVDYRGRVYIDEPFLNFQSSDLARGMMLFGEGKPMRREDTVWLAIHTANCYNQSYHINDIPIWCTEDYVSYLKEERLETISVDKMTLEDRAKWTEHNIDWILDLGENNEFDLKAEKKVNFLACCIEWFNYNNNIDNYISHLPIAIDGTSNGWQHLGAISKDIRTGELVGLMPVNIQKDFYVQTAKELINQTSNERLKAILKEMPMKDIRKGISKRGSMTKAYSAGAEKIAKNMWTDCKSEDYHDEYGITEDDCKGFAKKLVTAINIVCPGPLQTMSYLQKLAIYEIGRCAIDKNLLMRRKELGRISDLSEEQLQELSDINKEINKQAETIVYGNGSKNLSWTTPSGFPVEYTDWHMAVRKCKGTISQYRRVTHVVHEATMNPNIQGFVKGIAPNFIHSMDAAHMALVIDDWDKTFGAVHDSFSTHACDVEELLQVTKENFINIYNVPNFYDHIENQLISNKTDLDVDQPELGDLDIEDIYDSDYFFN